MVPLGDSLLELDNKNTTGHALIMYLQSLLPIPSCMRTFAVEKMMFTDPCEEISWCDFVHDQRHKFLWCSRSFANIDSVHIPAHIQAEVTHDKWLTRSRLHTGWGHASQTTYTSTYTCKLRSRCPRAAATPSVQHINISPFLHAASRLYLTWSFDKRGSFYYSGPGASLPRVMPVQGMFRKAQPKLLLWPSDWTWLIARQPHHAHVVHEVVEAACHAPSNKLPWTIGAMFFLSR